jgi:hypothetical protein
MPHRSPSKKALGKNAEDLLAEARRHGRVVSEVSWGTPRHGIRYRTDGLSRRRAYVKLIQLGLLTETSREFLHCSSSNSTMTPDVSLAVETSWC